MLQIETVATLLGISAEDLQKLDAAMVVRTGRVGVIPRIAEARTDLVEKTLTRLGVRDNGSVTEVTNALRATLVAHENKLIAHIAGMPGTTQFEQTIQFVVSIPAPQRGYFLKWDRAKTILNNRPPENTMALLGYASVDELLSHEHIADVMSALRFTETDEWMHQTFALAYHNFTADDFEERPIEFRVLGDRWIEAGKKFAAKKHHNVSHLKEFGVIFLNPIAEHIPGKTVRDCALLLHYSHEIAFYAALFRRYAAEPDFAKKLQSLLRGDVLPSPTLKNGAWLIVQRYLAKIDPSDVRLRLPHVDPEAMHWARAERDFARVTSGQELPFALWENLDWVADVLHDDAYGERVVSFDLEDNAMSLVSFTEGAGELFTYHEREALWTKLFSEYVGGEDVMEKLLIDNFENGIVRI